jgi:undecaprenyl-diphosphatase
MPLTYAIAVTAAFRNHVQEAIFLICSFMGGSLLNNLIKHVVARPRPDLFSAVIDIPADFSFPSSHAAQITSFVIAALLAMKSTKGTRWYVVFNGCGGSLIILVCVSRLYLQVHFPSDVVAGFLVGLLWVFGLATLMLPGHQAQTISLCTWRAEKGTQQ